LYQIGSGSARETFPGVGFSAVAALGSSVPAFAELLMLYGVKAVVNPITATSKAIPAPEGYSEK